MDDAPIPAALRPEVGTLRLRPPAHGDVPFLLGCLAFVAIGVWIIVEDGSLIGWAAVAFFGLGPIIYVIQVLPGLMSLQLDPEGFTVRHAWRTSRFRWVDVSGFRPWDLPAGGGELVGYDIEEHARPRGGWHARLLRINRALGADAALPSTYGLPAQQLADVLEAWRLAAAPGR